MITSAEQWELADFVMSALESLDPSAADRLRNPYDCGEPESVWFDGLPDLVAHSVRVDARTLDLFDAAVQNYPELNAAVAQVQTLRQISQTA